MAVAAAICLIVSITVFGRQSAEQIDRDKILGNGQDWKDKYDKYDPPADILAALKAKMDEHMKIDVYLGLWCPDSRNNVPVFVKIMDRVGISVPIRYFAVPRKATKTSSTTSKKWASKKSPRSFSPGTAKRSAASKRIPKPA